MHGNVRAYVPANVSLNVWPFSPRNVAYLHLFFNSSSLEHTFENTLRDTLRVTLPGNFRDTAEGHTPTNYRTRPTLPVTRPHITGHTPNISRHTPKITGHTPQITRLTPQVTCHMQKKGVTPTKISGHAPNITGHTPAHRQSWRQQQQQVEEKTASHGIEPHGISVGASCDLGPQSPLSGPEQQNGHASRPNQGGSSIAANLCATCCELCGFSKVFSSVCIVRAFFSECIAVPLCVSKCWRFEH